MPPCWSSLPPYSLAQTAAVHSSSAMTTGIPELGDQTLMDRTGEHRHAVPDDLVAEVLAGDADSARASRTQNIHIQAVPLPRRQHGAGSSHRKQTRTHVLLTLFGGVKRRRQLPIDRRGLRSVPIRCAETC